MSAEPVPPTQHAGPAPGAEGAQIIPLARTRNQRGRSGAPPSGGPDHPMTSPPGSSPEAGGPDPSLAAFAEHLELLYTAEGLTLSNRSTRAAFNVAVDIAITVMGGAQAQGIVGPNQRDQLVGLLEGVKRAGELAGDR